MTPFKAEIRTEGSKGGRRITVPVAIVHQLRATGFKPPGWARVSIEGALPFFATVRLPISRPSAVVTVPRWVVGLPMGQLSVMVEDATPFRARARTHAPFDWLPFVDTEHLPTEDNTGCLILHSRLEEPFRLLRHPVVEDAHDIAGWRERHATAPSMWFSSVFADQIENAAGMLERMGIERQRHKLEHRQHVIVLHVRKSTPLLRLLDNFNAHKTARK